MMMKFIYTFGAATYDQIRQKYFCVRHPTAASGRINTLRKGGYVHTFWHLKGERPHRCVKLKEKSFPWIERLWKERVDDPILEIDSLDRALCMNDLALRFEKFQIFDRMLSHRVIRGSSTMARELSYRNLGWQMCPGVLEVKKDGRKHIFPIELEFGTKTREHYDRKLRGYYEDGAVDGVLYLCIYNETMDVIAKVDEGVRKGEESLVYPALASSVIQAPGKLILTNCTGTRIGFD